MSDVTLSKMYLLLPTAAATVLIHSAIPCPPHPYSSITSVLQCMASVPLLRKEITMKHELYEQCNNGDQDIPIEQYLQISKYAYISK